MKRLICLIVTIVGITAIISAPTASTAASPEGTVTGIGSGSFPRGASFGGIDLASFEIATGVITESDGSAIGVFHADLAGRTILGTARILTLDGNVLQGSANNFSGLARLDLGGGVPAVSGVPFTVETQGGAMVLTIQSTVLPSAAFSEGGLEFGQ